MDKDSFGKLKEIIEKREEREHLSGGEVFVWWGLLNLIAMNVFHFWIYSDWVWIVMIITGIVGQVWYIGFLKRKTGVVMFWGKALSELWIFIVVLLPLLFYVFPVMAGIYSGKAIFPLIFISLCIAMYISGILTSLLAFKIGGVVYLLSAIVCAFKPEWVLYIFNLTTLFGLIIPGIWSFYERRKV